MSGFSPIQDDNSAAVGFTKGSFGHRMSKKVAELTQVVHMLFTKNHEREVEIDEMKEIFAEQANQLFKVTRSHLEKLEYQVREVERQKNRQIDHAADSTSQLLRDTQDKLEQYRQDFLEEKAETNRLRHQLIQANKEISQLKSVKSNALDNLEGLTRKLEQALSNASEQQKICRLTKEKLRTSDATINELRNQMFLLEEELRDKREQLLKANKALEDSSRSLDDVVKSHKKERSEQASRLENNRSVTDYRRTRGELPDVEGCELHELEIDRLRREIDWLKLELNNREGNFNRVFAKFQPVLVSPEKHQQQNQQQQRYREDSKLLMVSPSPGRLGGRPHGTSLPHIQHPAEHDSGLMLNCAPALYGNSPSPSRMTHLSKSSPEKGAKQFSPKVRLIFTKQ